MVVGSVAVSLVVLVCPPPETLTELVTLAGGVVGDSDREGDHWITGAGSERVAASTGQGAKHAGPTSAADGRGCQSGRQGVGDGDGAAGSGEAGVGGGDGIGCANLSLGEVAQRATW